MKAASPRGSHHFLCFDASGGGGSLSTSMLNVTCVSAVVGPVEYVLTFLAVVLIIMQHEAAAALTTVAPKGIDALVLAASIFFGTLVDIC